MGLSGFIDDDTTHRRRLGLNTGDAFTLTQTLKDVGIPTTINKLFVFKIKLKTWITYTAATQQTITFFEQRYPILKNKHNIITKTYPVNFTIMQAINYLTKTYRTLECKQTATAKYAQQPYQIKFKLTPAGPGAYLQQLERIKFRLDQLKEITYIFVSLSVVAQIGFRSCPTMDPTVLQTIDDE